MGDTGPCGPCSEIFFDHGPDIPGGPPGSPDEDGDRFNGKISQIDLPKPSIDTGMGLERTAAILQGKHDNYDTDLFQTLIGASVELTGVKPTGDAKFSHRVIADHLRSCSFLMADGVSPSNEGRGYVLRRIMRRAMRHAHLLGASAQANIESVFEQEEVRFRQTLGRGTALLEDATKSLSSGDKLDGRTAFKLYDTFGFPLDRAAQPILRDMIIYLTGRALSP